MASALVLLCLFSVSPHRGWARRGQVFSLGWGILWWSLQSTVYGLSCNHPCSSAQCSHIVTSNCAYGLVLDECGCCSVCGKGPGQLCGGIDNIEGRCGPGLECVPLEEEGLSQAELAQIPGLCQQVITDPPTSATVTTPGPAIFNESSESPTTNASTTPAPAEEQASKETETCLEKCSIEFCNDRARICSAEGLEYAPIRVRNRCQHTSCRACYMLVRPNCDDILCTTDPPTKSCLKKFYNCLRRHYFRGESSEALLLKLDDPRIGSLLGRIICHVPLLDRVEPMYLNYGRPYNS